MAEMDFGQGVGARCALHPDLVASRTCTRCGNFMCGRCSEDGTQAWCPNCRARDHAGPAFPLDRGNWSVSALLETCWAAFQREWLMICLGLVVVFAVAFAGQLVMQLFVAIGGATESVAVTFVFLFMGVLAFIALLGLLITGYLRMLLDVLDGHRADLARLFSQFHKAVPYLLTLLLLGIFSVPIYILYVSSVALTAIVTGLLATSGLSLQGLESLRPEDLSRVFAAAGSAVFATMTVAGGLYIVLLMWLGLPLMLMHVELAANDAPSPMDVLRRCFVYARGQRLPMLGIVLLGFPLFIVGAVACCVGLIPAVGFFYLLLAGLYLSLRNGAEVD